MELRWQPSFDVSALHAAWVIAGERPLLDKSFQERLGPVALELAGFAPTLQIAPDLFWRQLLGLAADLPINAELADRLIKRLQGGSSPAMVGHLASAIADVETVTRQRYPRLLDELALRVAPLQSAWEARGPGLLALMSATTDPEFLVESAGIVLVQPVYGGDGLAHIYTNRVHIEAVLTDVDPRLPEVLRLAWLLGQLNLDRPIFSEQVHGHRLGQIAELALIPVVLSAAEQVQLCTMSAESLTLALQMWTRRDLQSSQRLAQVLSAWWETSTEGAWSWQTRLSGLAAMLDQ